MNEQIRLQELHGEIEIGKPRSAATRLDDGVVLTPEQLRSRRARNVAIGLAVGFFALLFYAITIAKLIHFGPGFLERPM